MANSENKYNSGIYQLDELLQNLYNAVYAKSNDFTAGFIDVADLKMSRFKLYDYDLDLIFEKTPTKYVGNYPTGIMDNGTDIEQIWVKRAGETDMCTVRIIPYMNKDSVNKMSDPINVNQVVKTLLSELVVGDKTNNTLLPIVNIDVKGSDLIPYDKIKPLVDEDKYYSIQITEKFYSLTTLDNFLRNYPLDQRVIKTIIYQAVDVLYQISRSFSNFRYNQFIPEMIDCYLKKNDDIVFPELKLSDFYLSDIGDVISNDYLKSGQIHIPHIDSSYSDLYQLLNYLWNHIATDIKKYPELVSLFDIILPKKIRSEEIYLTKKLWDELTEEEKYDLEIKNIRNNTFFTSKDSLLGTFFIKTNDINDAYGGNSESENNMNSSDSLNESGNHFESKYSKSNINFEEDSENINLDEDSENSKSRVNQNINKLKTNINKKSNDSNDLFENTSDQRFLILNKKYSDNDIGNMSNKKYNQKNKLINNSSKNNISKNKSLKDDFYYDEDQVSDYTENYPERTEERSETERPSRIINVSDSGSRKTSKNKLKKYHGQRFIGNNLNNNNSYQKEGYEALINAMYRTGTQQQPMDTQNYDNNLMINGVPSRINAVGSALGAMPNEYNTRGQNINYQQMVQQLSQQYQNPSDNSQVLPGHLPPNISSQIPNQIQNPLGQNQMNQQDSEAYQRYLLANQGQLQSQIDPSYHALLMQQQQQQNPMAQMQMSQNLPQLQQMGGAKRNNFFFQQ